ESVLDRRIDGRGETGGNGDDIVTRPQAPAAKLLVRKTRQGQQIRRRPRVDQNRRTDPKPFCELMFEFSGKSAGRQPEIERGVEQVLQVVGVEHAPGHGDARNAWLELPRRKSGRKILADELPQTV